MADHSQDKKIEPGKVIPLRTTDENMRIALAHAEESLSAFVGDYEESGAAWTALNTILFVMRTILAGVTTEAIDDQVMKLVGLMKLFTEVADENAALKELLEEQPKPPGQTAPDPELERLGEKYAALSLTLDEARDKNAANTAELARLRNDNAALNQELGRLREENATLSQTDRSQLQRLGAALNSACAELRLASVTTKESIGLETQLVAKLVARAEESSRTFGKVEEMIGALKGAAETITPGRLPAASAPPPSGLSLDKIEAEIGRRHDWCSKLSEIMFDFQAVTDADNERIKEIDNELLLPETKEAARLNAERSARVREIAAIEKQTTRFVEVEKTVTEQLRKLERMKRQMIDLQEGTDLSFLNDDLPEIAPGKMDEIETASGDAGPPPQPPPAASAPPSGALDAIAAREGMTRGALLAVTLLEVAVSIENPRTGKMIRGRRLFDLFEAARTAKIIQRYGWRVAREAQDSVDGNKFQRMAFEKFVEYTSPRATIPVLGRNGRKLPWKVQEVLTAEEVGRFSLEIGKNNTAK